MALAATCLKAISKNEKRKDMNDMTQLGLGVFALAALNILIPMQKDIDARENQIEMTFNGKDNCQTVSQNVLGNGVTYTFCEDGTARRQSQTVLPIFASSSSVYDLPHHTVDDGAGRHAMSPYTESLLCNTAKDAGIDVPAIARSCPA